MAKSTKEIKTLAIITTDLNYNGGTIAIISAARAMLRFGYEVTIISPYGDINIINEVNAFGISVIIYPSFLNMGKEEQNWICKFDFLIVNVLQSIDCAIKTSLIIPMLWWIHEPSEKYCSIYASIICRYPLYFFNKKLQSIPVFTVSSVARRTFNKYFPNVSTQILPYCVQDEAAVTDKKQAYDNRSKKITFALIAGFSELKQQMLFLDAAEKINKLYAEKIQFLLIGKVGEDAYSRDVFSHAERIPNVEVKGVLTREQIAVAYKEEIDVVVCPSLEETMSLTITEGMMYGKICITSDNTGMAEYIKDGENGFVCKTKDLDSLYEKMKYCIENFENLEDVRKSARKTFEENFTMEIFGKRLDGIIQDIMNNSNISKRS